MEVIALSMNPSITPNISNVVASLSFLDAAIIRRAVRPAPKNADMVVDNAPIPANVAVAAPSEAPEVIPRICGSANGLRRMLCIWIPERARAAPAMRDVSVLGILSSHRMS